MKKRGHVVAVASDGANDAPALREVWQHLLLLPFLKNKIKLRILLACNGCYNVIRSVLYEI